MEKVLLFITAGILSLIFFGVILQLAIMGLRKFLEVASKFFMAIIILSAFVFVGYVAINHNEIKKKIDDRVYKKPKKEDAWSRLPGAVKDEDDEEEVNQSKVSDTYIPTRNLN